MWCLEILSYDLTIHSPRDIFLFNIHTFRTPNLVSIPSKPYLIVATFLGSHTVCCRAQRIKGSEDGACKDIRCSLTSVGNTVDGVYTVMISDLWLKIRCNRKTCAHGSCLSWVVSSHICPQPSYDTSLAPYLWDALIHIRHGWFISTGRYKFSKIT